MTRRLAVVRAVAAPDDIATAVVAAYPGTILVVEGAGIVTRCWGGAAAPLRTDGVVGRSLHAVLGLADDALAAGQLQLWLACAIGVDAEMFQLSLGDPPRQLPAAVGRGVVDLGYGAVFDARGRTSAVVVFVNAASAESESRAAQQEVADPEHVARFFAETQPLLDVCHAELAKLEADREARQSVHRTFRAMHTLKGAARSAGLGAIAEQAHAIETRLAVLREQGHQTDAEELAAIRELVRRLGDQISLDAPHDAVVDTMASLYSMYRPAIARADEAFAAWNTRLRDGELAAAFERALRELLEVVEPFGLRALSTQVVGVIELAESARATARPERRLLAGIDRQLTALHELVELYRDVYREIRACDNPTRVVRELAHANGDVANMPTLRVASAMQLACVREDLARMFAPAPVSIGARASLASAQRTLLADAAKLRATSPGVDSIAASIIATAERLTWVGLDDVVRRVRRTARTVATELGKQVDVEVDAFGVVVPEEVHRMIGEVLLHAVRNSLDHGIETVEERRASGKPAAGTIRIGVIPSGEGVQLEIIDDGRGVDLERVRAKAIANGLLSEAARPSPRELHELVFRPGLSTAARVSELSGRGVGMDVIRSLAEEHGGTAELSSAYGQWTRLLVRLPAVRGTP